MSDFDDYDFDGIMEMPCTCECGRTMELDDMVADPRDSLRATQRLVCRDCALVIEDGEEVSDAE